MSLASAILLTLKYSAHFSFPLTASEIYPRLILHKTTVPLLKKELNNLVTKKLLGVTKGYYYLSGDSRLVARRLKQEQASHPLQHRARVLAAELFSLPGVLAFYLTGSLAVGNAGDDGDIDLLIVAYPQSLWITRFFLTLTTSLLGLRRKRNSRSYHGKLCLNLYLTPQAFTIPASRRSLYTAYELIQIVPLYDPYNSYPHLLLANPWIKKYLPNYVMPNLNSPFKLPHTPYLLRLFEPLAFALQYAFMRPRITRELITRDSAFFHPHNPGDKILTQLGVK